MIAKITFVIFAVVLHVYTAGLYFLYSGGIFTLCYGSSASWSEEVCNLIRNDAFTITTFTLLLLIVVSHAYIALIQTMKLGQVARFLLHVSVPLIGINLLGFFAPLEVCLGFLGCNTIYYWPLTISYSVGLLTGFCFYALFFHPPNVLRCNWKHTVKVGFAITVIGGLLAWGTVRAVDYLNDAEPTFIKDLFSETRTDSHTETKIIPLEDEGSTSNYRISINAHLTLAVDSENVAVKLVDGDNSLIAPINLRPVPDSSTEDDWISDSRDFYIEDGVTYSGLPDEYPSTYHVFASSSDLVDMSLLAARTAFANVRAFPIYSGMRLQFTAERESGRTIFQEIKYDFSGDGTVDGQISWKEKDCLLSLSVIESFIENNELTNMDRLRLLHSVDMLRDHYHDGSADQASFIDSLEAIGDMPFVREHGILEQLAGLHPVCEPPKESLPPV